MQISENNETLYDPIDITDELLDEIVHEIFEYGTAYGKNRAYINDFMTMDIETSVLGRETDEPVAFTYTIAVYLRERCFLFRKWLDYNIFINRLGKKLYLSRYFRLVCYVHNLPYEFQFMRDFMHIEEVFAVKPRKVVKCFSEGIEYRCSYKLTNMGLARFTDTIPSIIHGKLSGDDFDYSIFRTPTTKLSSNELDYIFNDVAGLYEALDYTIKHDEYNLATIPNTSTGFVRNELRREMAKNPVNRREFLKNRLNQLTYGLLRTARRGGNTHCNPVYSDDLLEDLTSMDMSSAYPAVMVQCKFPMTPFQSIRRAPDFEKYVNDYACILDVTFHDLIVKNLDSIPYIPKAHCTGFPKFKKGEKEIKDTWEATEFCSDNGRVLKASELSMVITDIDYKIIKDTYEWSSVECRVCLISEYKYLPDELRLLILKQYYDKTTLKDSDPYLYMKQKNKFNANFGCMLTDICQDEVVYKEHSSEPFVYEKEASYQEQLDKYYSSRNSFLSYQHGVWVTAHCRDRLQKAIQRLEYNMVYCDTDSVKFFDYPELHAIFDELNNEIDKEIEECGLDCTVEYKGKTYTLGHWEPDGDYEQFVSMGAKKYAYIDKKNPVCNPEKYNCGHEDDCPCRFLIDDVCWWKKFQITVAGLSKSKAKEYMFDNGGIELFKAGTVIPKNWSGRTKAKYNDYTQVHTVKLDNGEVIPIGSNMVIEDATYKFNLTEDYENLLVNIQEGVIY